MSAPRDERDKGSISHSALNIQKELAFEQGVTQGRLKYHENLSLVIQKEREKGNTTISLDLLERLSALWTGGA